MIESKYPLRRSSDFSIEAALDRAWRRLVEWFTRPDRPIEVVLSGGPFDNRKFVVRNATTVLTCRESARTGCHYKRTEQVIEGRIVFQWTVKS